MVKFVATAFVKSSLGLIRCKINAVVHRIFQHVHCSNRFSEQTKAPVFLLTLHLSIHFVYTRDDVDRLLVEGNLAENNEWNAIVLPLNPSAQLSDIHFKICIVIVSFFLQLNNPHIVRHSNNSDKQTMLTKFDSNL